MSTVEKLKAIQTNDIKFIYDEADNFLTYNKKANVTIKVGSLEKEIQLHTTYKGQGEDRKEVISDNLERIFPDVYKIGLLIDINELIENYKKERKIVVKQNNEKLITHYSKHYYAHWVHRMENLNIPDGLKITFDTLEEYITRSVRCNRPLDIIPKLTYKNITQDIIYTDVSTSFSTNNRFTIESDITKWRRRSYKTLDKLIEKFVQLVDFKISSDEAAKIAQENRNKEDNVFKEHLITTFGEKYISVRKTQRNHGVTLAFSIKVNRFERDISLFLTEEGYLYNIAGFYRLTTEQVKGIIKALEI